MRMVRAAFATAVMVGGCLAVAGCVTTQVGNQGAGKTIRYEVTGDSGTANNVTYMINQGEQQETNVALPWSKEFTADGKFQAFVVNAQNAGAGSISCKITVAGQVINQQTSNGQYAVVMCSGS
jgi:Mycobacterium membrane protein